MECLVDGMFVGMDSEDVAIELEAMELLDEFVEGYSLDDFEPYGETYLGDEYAEYYGIWFDEDGVCIECEWMNCEE